ncbi:MAG TPA: hypothetical protein VFH33_04110 [Candidatus Krumholzibacteria bacterium]|nr:hypothetical protein [Candidatus Krumholzibacteria bacterium]
MKLTFSRTSAVAIAAALSLFYVSSAHAQAAADSLLLSAPTGVKAYSVYDPGEKRFVVWITWKDIPNNVGTLISTADTTGWSLATPPAGLSFPTVSGAYTGDIDRTVAFHATRAGDVGTDSLTITYEVRREEYFSGRVNIGSSYVPGTVIPLNFRDQRTNTPVNFGLSIAFSAGHMDLQGTFVVGLEDFEGFHIWRSINHNGSDMEIIGEVSKQEAFKGRATGGSLPDSVYFYDIVPKLRTHSTWISPFGSIECLGTTIDTDLDPDGFFWFDCNGSNGFTYYYAVTTFDRGYNVASGTQGLAKHDNCTPSEGTPYPCKDQLIPVALSVDPQNDLYNVYVVPNPVRTGSSRLTTDNYHNFPDGRVRFVNLPVQCVIKIFTVAGDLVWTKDKNDSTGNVEWDTRNYSEEDVASGVYVYRIEAGSSSVYGRIVVIR